MWIRLKRMGTHNNQLHNVCLVPSKIMLTRYILSLLCFSLCSIHIFAKPTEPFSLHHYKFSFNPLIINEPLEIKTVSLACFPSTSPDISSCKCSNVWAKFVSRSIKDQPLQGHIEDHESLCDQTGKLSLQRTNNWSS